jgi:hypothetical protein
VRPEAQKAAWDHGFRLETRGRERRLAALRLDHRTRRGLDRRRASSWRWLLSINHPSVAAELATPAIFAPTWARPRHLRFRHPDRVHAPLDRVYKLGVSLPDAPAARCESAWNKDPVFGVSTGTRAATAGCGISQSARPSGLAHRSSHASTAVAAICASPPSRRLCFGCHHKREAQMGEAEMVCLGAKDILPGGGRAVADR